MSYTSQVFATGAELDEALVAALGAMEAAARAEVAAAAAEAFATEVAGAIPDGAAGDFVVIGSDGKLVTKTVALAEGVNF